MSGDELDDLDAQIAALQAKKATKLAKAEIARKAEEKEAKKILIGATPTKVKPTITAVHSPPPKQPVFAPKASQVKQARQVLPSIPPQAGPSRLSSSLAALRHKPTASRDQDLRNGLGGSRGKRSASDELEVDPDQNQGMRKGKGVQRDNDDLTVRHDLKIGPKEHGLDPEGENEWSFHEPNSGIRLSKRTMSHAAVQGHLDSRYYLPPTLLYSVIRLSRDGSTYDLPVDGDWLTIAVVAERGEVKISGTKQTSANDDDDGDDDIEEDEDGPAPAAKPPAKNTGPFKPGDPKNKSKKSGTEYKNKKRPPRKYINLKLCSLPPRTKTSSSSAGDALLQLLLFESDSVAHDTMLNDEGEKVVIKRYSGGSGGAYEKWCNLTVGSVIAIMNPKVLRPLRAGSQAPHPLTLPLALNPTSGDNIWLIGQSKDLGRCAAQQKDGNRCRTWVDLRENQVCEYHVHAAVQRGKSGRAEFTASTSSFALTTRPGPAGSSSGRGGGSNYDPRKKTGLLPSSGPGVAPRTHENGGGGATYIIGGGGVVNTGRTDGGLRGLGDEHLGEKLGRRRAEKRKKRDEEKETEEALKRLMARDGAAQSTGGKYLAQIGVEVGGKGKKPKAGDEVDDRKRAFSAQAIKRIGFDPTLPVGGRGPEDKGKRAESINLLKRQEGPIKLGKPAGMGFSSVRAPVRPLSPPPTSKATITREVVMAQEDDDGMIDLD